jgi:phosphate uptake regulator
VLIDQGIDPRIVVDMKGAIRKAMTILNASMRALFSANIVDANRTIDMVDDLEKMTDDISAFALQKKGPLALSIGYVAESIRRAGEYAGDISESIINQIVSEIED